MNDPLHDQDLTTPEGRERALDRLGTWFVEQVLAAGDDEEALFGCMRRAIVAFYDVREAADQPRGMYAGHFYLVDAVGLDDSDRPIPWHVLAERVGRDRVEQLLPIFDRAERDAD